MSPPRLRTVFAAYLMAFVSIVALSLLAAGLVLEMYPDVPEAEVFSGLPGLLAGALASSVALMLTLLAVHRPFDVARLRLRPGREKGVTLVLVILGTLAVGQALDSAVTLLGLGQRGALAVIRRALEGAAGPDLFAAVVVIGVVAGATEEVFFRGYIQTALRRHWRSWAAVPLTSLGFAIFHPDPTHAVLAFALGIWLGFVTERTASALPAVAAHVVNNVAFTLLTALGVGVEGAGPNAALGLAAVLVFVGCAVGVGRRPGGTPAVLP
jgi:membrane protease YdiL (CAAX protease family)